MKLSGNTILVTGGSSGIGLELSNRLLQKGNRVLICGRSTGKLLAAKERYPGLSTFPCDLEDAHQCRDLMRWILKEHPGINVLINNAATVHKGLFLETENVIAMAESEMAVNFFAPLRLISGLYPEIRKNGNGAIVNVTTGLVYTPRAVYPFYNSTKAALHSFTQVLRKQSEDSCVQIVEVMFPAVRTPWHGDHPPEIAISPERAVEQMIKGLEKDRSEVRIGRTRLLYYLSRVAPRFAFKKVNGLR